MIKRGVALGKLSRFAEEVETYDEVVHVFGKSDEPAVTQHVAAALLKKGERLTKMGRLLEALDVYDHISARFSCFKARAIVGTVALACLHKGVILAYATGEEGSRKRLEAVRWFSDVSACERGLSAILKVLSESNELPPSVIHAVMTFVAFLEPGRAIELIQGSGAADLLLPLLTALQHELGVRPRVAEEVNEVAEDIRKDLVRMRTIVSRSNTIATAHD